MSRASVACLNRHPAKGLSRGDDDGDGSGAEGGVLDDFEEVAASEFLDFAANLKNAG